MTYPNQIYSAFSFIGFLLCAIPFYWQLEGKFRPDPNLTKMTRPTWLQLGTLAPPCTLPGLA